MKPSARSAQRGTVETKRSTSRRVRASSALANSAVSQSLWASTSRPPGRRTRWQSSRWAAGSARCSATLSETTRSSAPSANGSASDSRSASTERTRASCRTSSSSDDAVSTAWIRTGSAATASIARTVRPGPVAEVGDLETRARPAPRAPRSVRVVPRCQPRACPVGHGVGERCTSLRGGIGDRVRYPGVAFTRSGYTAASPRRADVIGMTTAVGSTRLRPAPPAVGDRG